jgi:hypothetical protein
MDAYMQALVDEFKMLWEEGIKYTFGVISNKHSWKYAHI